MRRYELGDPDLDARVQALARDAAPGDDRADDDLIAEMIVSVLKLHRDRAGRGDLKLINSVLKELRYAFMIFSQYRDMKKVTVFGSARTPSDHPAYRLAADFGERMADKEKWMVVTGAGPGIMEAANRGAGGESSFGVAIRLPFEAEANPYVDDSRLINFKYFFTRKLLFIKESNAFALFPGGFGTLDETFELLTLTQTGKTTIHPIVLIEEPGNDYWEKWLDLVESTLIPQGMIAREDLALFTRATNVDAAADEITHFYANYHSQRYVGDHLVLRTTHPIESSLVDELNDEFGDVLVSGRIEAISATDAEIANDDHVDLPRLRMHFDRRSHGRLRKLIDALNDAVDGLEAPRA